MKSEPFILVYLDLWDDARDERKGEKMQNVSNINSKLFKVELRPRKNRRSQRWFGGKQ